MFARTNTDDSRAVAPKVAEVSEKQGHRGDRRHGYEVAFESPSLAELTATDQPGAWSLCIRGNRDIALRVGAGTKYWNGELKIPVELSCMNGPTPGRAWWTESDVPPEER